MTIAHTARKKGRDVLAFLTACCALRSADARDALTARRELSDYLPIGK